MEKVAQGVVEWKVGWIGVPPYEVEVTISIL